MAEQPLLSRVDGLVVRESGPWAVEKLYYVARYMGIFNGGMKKSWPQRAYVDLMAGPGLCVDRNTGDEFDGSPLLALKSEPPFSIAAFVEADSVCASALRTRTTADQERRVVLDADCNAPSTVTEIRRIVGSRQLTLCFVDNIGLNVTFNTIAALSEGARPIDFIFTFQVSDLTRNVQNAMSTEEGERFDAFFGSQAWRDVVARFERGETGRSDVATALADFYGQQLNGIGYGQVEQLHRPMKNTRNAPLYRLLLASRHPRATDFFRKIGRIEPGGQRLIRFDR